MFIQALTCYSLMVRVPRSSGPGESVVPILGFIHRVLSISQARTKFQEIPLEEKNGVAADMWLPKVYSLSSVPALILRSRRPATFERLQGVLLMDYIANLPILDVSRPPISWQWQRITYDATISIRMSCAWDVLRYSCECSAEKV